MVLDHSWADPQGFGTLPIIMSIGHQSQHITLTRGMTELPDNGWCACLSFTKDVGLESFAQPSVTAIDGSNGLDEHRQALGLAQVAIGAAAQSLRDALSPSSAPQNLDTRLWESMMCRSRICVIITMKM